MAGAYTAKPAATPTTEYPPGWDLDWSFPGPHPPGFIWDNVDTDVYPFEANEAPDTSAGIIVYPWTCETHEDSREILSSSDYDNVIYICLRGRPTANVVIPVVTESGYEEGRVYTGTPGVSLTFTSANYDIPQRVVLEGVNDSVIDGDYESIGILVGPAVSSDTDYNGLTQHVAIVTNLEEVNKIEAIAIDITASVGYSAVSGEEDYVIFSVAIYETATSVTSLTNVIASGTILAERFAQYHHDGTITYTGDDTPYVGQLAVSADDIDESHKYWVVTSIDLIGPIGTSTASCGCRTYLKYEYTDSTITADDVTLEDYTAAGTHSGTFGTKAYQGWVLLNNAETVAANKISKTLTTYSNDYLEQLAQVDEPVLYSYGGDTTGNGAVVFDEYSNTYVGSWSNYVGSTIATTDLRKKRFWAWTRWMEYGVWSLTTIGTIDTDGTMQSAIGSFDAVGVWSTSPRTGDDEQGTWWLMELLQSPRASADSLSDTKPITGELNWQAFDIHYTSSETYTPHKTGPWMSDWRKSYTYVIYNNITLVTTTTSGTVTGLFSGEVPSEIRESLSSVTYTDEYDSTSSAGTDAISIGGSNIKTWDYYNQ